MSLTPEQNRLPMGLRINDVNELELVIAIPWIRRIWEYSQQDFADGFECIWVTNDTEDRARLTDWGKQLADELEATELVERISLDAMEEEIHITLKASQNELDHRDKHFNMPDVYMIGDIHRLIDIVWRFTMFFASADQSAKWVEELLYQQ